MRRLILPLLTASYFSLSLIFAVLIWRNGGGWGAGVAALAGGLGLCFTFHGLITGVLGQASLRKEIDTLRHAHRLLVGQIEPGADMTAHGIEVMDGPGGVIVYSRHKNFLLRATWLQ